MTQATGHGNEVTNLGMLPVLRHYEEKRSYPRIDLRVPVMISTADGGILKGRTRNLSAEGLQLRCDGTTAKILYPPGTQIPQGEGPAIIIRLRLPLGGEKRSFVAGARLAYIAACRPGEIAFGVRFTQIQPHDKSLLAEFIMESMRPG